MHVERVLAPNPGPMTLTGTNTYLLQHADEVAVIDPGPELPEHLAAILARAKQLGRITTVLVTHRHGDHLPAAFPLCERTGATLRGHKDLPGVHQALDDDAPAFASLRALNTPGHTRDSQTFFDPLAGALFTGDLVAGSGTVIVDDTPGALADYIASLERLRTLSPRTIYPGHGPFVADAMAKLDEYIGHRRAREQQVVVTLCRGPATVEALTSAIYPDVAPNLAPMAARNVRACLDKLTADGRVSATADKWTLIG